MSQAELESKPESVAYIPRVIAALRSMEGVAKASAVKDAIVTTMTEQKLPINEVMLASGVVKYQNDIQWARMFLVNAGMLEPSDPKSRGIWKLTPQGWQTPLDPAAVLAIYAQSAKKSKKAASDTQTAPSDEGTQQDLPGLKSWESEVKKLLQTMPDKGFERLCAEIMTRNGLHATKVTGQSNDKGIDGEGLLAFDDLELVSIRVAWQCKRFKDGKVGSVDVRNFRGSLDMSTEHGIIFTTSAFTAEAINEASQPAKKTIKLVDLDGLISKLDKLKLGILEGTSRAVDAAFFGPYLNPEGLSPVPPLLTAATK